MDEYLVYEGTKEEIYCELAEDFKEAGEHPLTREECDRLIEFLQKNKNLLADEELFKCEKPERNAAGASEFIMERMSYYIGIQKTTLYVLLFLIDKTCLGTVSFLSKLLGFQYPEKTVLPVDEENGLKCIVMELARNRKKGADSRMFEKYKGECCNNQFQCKHRQGEKCVIKQEEIKETLDMLKTNNVVKNKGDRYYYQF